MAKIQAKFFTKQEQYSVPDHEIHISLSSDGEQLNKVVNGLLKRGENEQEISFEFLIDGEFLRDSIEEHLRERDSLKTLKTDTHVEIEYVESAAPPTPSDSIMQEDWVMAVRASNGHILCGSYDHVVRLWTLSGQLVHSISGHKAVVKSVAWIRDGEDEAEKTFVSASHDGTARLWQWNQKTKVVECIGIYAVPVSSRPTLSRSIDGVSVSPNKSMFATASQNYIVDVWSTEPSGDGDKPKKKRKTENPVLTNEVPQLSLEGHTDSVSAVCWMDNKTVCSAAMDHTLRLWDVKKGVNKTSITGPTVFLDVQYSPLSGLIVTGSCDRNVRIYDTRTTGAALAKCSYTSHSLWVSCVYWSPVSEYHFVSGSYDSVFKLWDTRSPKAPLYDMTGHEGKIFCCDWSVPEFMISGGEDKHVRLFKSSDNPTV